MKNTWNILIGTGLVLSSLSAFAGPTLCTKKEGGIEMKAEVPENKSTARVFDGTRWYTLVFNRKMVVVEAIPNKPLYEFATPEKSEGPKMGFILNELTKTATWIYAIGSADEKHHRFTCPEAGN